MSIYSNAKRGVLLLQTLFDFKNTALVVVDLQRWLGNQYAPYSAEHVVGNAAKLVSRFRDEGSFVALVHVSSSDFKDIPSPLIDGQPPKFNLVDGWNEIVPEIGVTEHDHPIVKKQWGAFYGTDLDLQLRRRGITTVVLCGIATGIGVDTTAREAYQHGYNLILAEDAMTGFSEAEHEHVVKYIFPRIGRVRTTEDILSVAY